MTPCQYAPCSDCAEDCPKRIGRKPWSRKETDILIRLWPHETPQQIGDRIGRSADSCRTKYRSLKASQTIQ